MLPTLSNKALATILSVASGLAWAGPGPNISGPYLGDAYGQVDFRMEGERVVGTAAGKGGPCQFEPGTEVISGELQGNVLVGTVLLCQVGRPECAAREPHPALIFVNPQDRVLSALIRLREGCTSPALKQNLQLFLRATAPQEEAREAEPESDSEPEPESEAGAEEARAPAATAPAAGVAQARQQAPEVLTLDEGQRQLAAGNHAAAQPHFEHVLRTDPRNISAVVGLAACQLGRGDADGALKTLEPAAKTSSRPDLHLWLAHAYSMDKNRFRAREVLRKLMDLGWTPGNRPAEAIPETALKADIEAVMQQRSRKRTPGREAIGSGSTSP
ncbi:tetratricopeptide repeat protein [Pyxidicoccus trucidator]|uniref:tetratricopeptide repeat protein n=1 Tax=Pyxidicoccus trucidator TaxID=2709662 RepID=UPI0013DB9158|nr:tetratricopeptide repeat protein [Pyxidicoccus trucidator]